MIFRNVIWVKGKFGAVAVLMTPLDTIGSQARDAKNDIGSEDNHDDEKDMGDGNDDNGDSHARHGIWRMVEGDVYVNDVGDEEAIKDDQGTTWT